MMLFHKTLALALPFFFLPFLVPQNDPAAEQLLKQVQEKYEAYANMKIQYVQTITNPESDLDQTLGGTLYLMDDNFRIETAGQVLMSDNEKLYIYFIEENELTIDYMEDDEVFKPSDIFNLYNKDFKYTQAGTTTIDGAEHAVILFTPVRKDDYDLHTIRLFINKSNYSISKAELKDKSNNLVVYAIKKVTPNLDISSSFFRFDTAEHPGVIVTDNTK